ncbi:hypothetical protein CHS0354_042950 [Potamilus streckersoni]|uniref:Uncharacterized protein n=1 Tax=Potamilus streckersoni TaxID=2493646 RepID=A0AAE0T676_9BIVA|nr:hypothetical protein CHS0354_042950 [Potamilus streckersoni]
MKPDTSRHHELTSYEPTIYTMDKSIFLKPNINHDNIYDPSWITSYYPPEHN